MTSEIKKKVNRADYMFDGKTGETLMKKPGDVNGLDFMIRNLTDCTVYLLDYTTQVSSSSYSSCADFGRQMCEHDFCHWSS